MADISERYKEALRLGHVAVVRGRPREALQHYEDAGRLAGHRPLPFVSIGGVLLQMRRPQEALVAFDEALRRAPDDLGALRGKAQALGASGRRAEASALAERISALEAEQGPSGMPRSADPQGSGTDAEQHFAEACRAQAAGAVGPAIAAYLLAARAFAGRNAMDAALDACQRALELSPGHADVHLAMAAIYLQRGWRQHALERLTLLDHVLRLEPMPATRAALEALVREHRAQHPELAGLIPGSP